MSKLFNLGWPIVARKYLKYMYVSSRRKAEKLCSAVADVAGTSSNLVKRQTLSSILYFRAVLSTIYNVSLTDLPHACLYVIVTLMISGIQ